jgi:hypothetical protein
MILDGGEFSRIYDLDYFDAKVRAYGMNTKDIPNNIPTNALALMPVAWLPAEAAKICWSVISLVALAFSIRIMFQVYEIPLGDNLGLGLMTMCFVWRPLYDNIALGQLYMVILLLFCISLRGLQRENSILAALPVGAVFVIKGYGIVPTLLMATRKKWKMVLLSAVFILLVFALTLPLVGLSSWTQFYILVVANLGTIPSEGHVAYQTINGFVHHLFLYDPKWSPFPVAELPTPVVIAMSCGLSILLISIVLRKIRSDERYVLLLSYSAAIAVSVVTVPAAEEYHYVLFLPLVIGLVSFRVRGYLQTRRVTLIDVALICAILLIALPLKYKELQFESFPTILLAYPRLIAGIVLLLLVPKIAIGSSWSPENHIASLDRNGYIPANPNEIR